MGKEFEMSMMGELAFFLGLQIKQSSNGISIIQEKYIKELLKKFTMFDSKPRDSHLKAAKCILRNIKKTGNLVLFYLAGYTFDLVGFADADFAGYQVDRKRTYGMAHFLGSSLISWGTKKQNFVALSTAQAEYVAAAACCSQLLWIKQHLEDINIKAIPLM